MVDPKKNLKEIITIIDETERIYGTLMGDGIAGAFKKIRRVASAGLHNRNAAKKRRTRPSAAAVIRHLKPDDGMLMQTQKLAGNPTDDAVRLCESIIDMSEEVAEQDGINVSGFDFAVSVKEKVSSILETIEKRGEATESQLQALENMQEGLSKWLK